MLGEDLWKPIVGQYVPVEADGATIRKNKLCSFADVGHAKQKEVKKNFEAINTDRYFRHIWSNEGKCNLT